MGTQSQSNMMDGMRQPNLNPERQMPTLNRQEPAKKWINLQKIMK